MAKLLSKVMSYYYLEKFNELWPDNQSGKLESIRPGITCQSPLLQDCYILNNKKNHSTPVIILPDLFLYIVAHHLKDGSARISLVGPRTHSITINRKRRTKTLMIKIPPLYLEHLLPFPIQEITNRSATLGDIFGDELQEEALEKVRSNEENRFFQLLLKQLQPFQIKNDKISRAGLFFKHSAYSNVAQAAKAIGISNRHLQKIVNRQIGIAPKKVLKIKRLTASLQLKTTNFSISFAQLALESGYYDQSHMIAEYQEFIGKTPGELFE